MVVDLKPHWWYFAKSGSAVVIAAAGALWASMWDESNDLERWGGLIIAASFALCALWMLLRWMKWRSTHFVVTSDRVIFRSGIIVKRGVAIPLERVDNIAFEQTVFERIIRSGDVRIESAGPEGQQDFFDIKRPDEVQKLIHSQIEDNDRRSRASLGTAPDLASQLERLEGLRDRGTLTQEEFLREKDRLLAQG